MTWTRGTYVRKDTTRGTTPAEARLALEGIFHELGVIRGLTVSGTSGWAYSVAAGHLVTKRTSGDGVILFANDGPVNFATDPAPGSGSRWDVLWVRHNDVDQADADSDVAYGVAIGTASGSPTVPSLPSGAFELGRALVPSGSANTGDAGVVISQATARARLAQHEAVPYAWAQGTVSLPSINAGSSASVNVTFPTGRFPIIPRVMAWSNAARLAPILTTAITTSGCTITAWNWTSGTAPGSTAIWRAMIMSEDERDG